MNRVFTASFVRQFSFREMGGLRAISDLSVKERTLWTGRKVFFAIALGIT